MKTYLKMHVGVANSKDWMEYEDGYVTFGTVRKGAYQSERASHYFLPEQVQTEEDLVSELALLLTVITYGHDEPYAE